MDMTAPRRPLGAHHREVSRPHRRPASSVRYRQTARLRQQRHPAWTVVGVAILTVLAALALLISFNFDLVLAIDWS